MTYISKITAAPIDPATLVIPELRKSAPSIIQPAPVPPPSVSNGDEPCTLNTTTLAPLAEATPADSDHLFASGIDKGGEGGSAAIITPPSPPSALLAAANAASALGDVYTPAPKTNPVLDALRLAGLYLSPAGERKHRITCPWEAEHAADGAQAAYMEPADHMPIGGFSCSPCRQRGRNIVSLLDHLGVEAQSARCKPTIRIQRGEYHRVTDAAELGLAGAGNYYQSGV